MTRLAMWSGPRNISTALMRSWGSRPDTFVSDEPFYAAYLRVTGLDHPGAAEVIAHHESDPERVVEHLLGPIPGGKALWYQKHMAHHMLPGFRMDWIGSMRNCLLLREPRAMLASLSQVIPNPTPEQTGLPQQLALFEMLAAREGRPPPVILASDILADPRAALTALCAALDVPFAGEMLAWAPGPRDTDGVWAPHWYSRVYASTGFEPPPAESTPSLAPHLHAVLDACRPIYDKLAAHRLRP